VKRVIAALAVVAVGLTGAALAWLVAERERDYRANVIRGDAALRDDLTFAAIEAYSGAIALHPDSMIAYLRRGETYRRRADRGDLEAAARDFRTAAALDPLATRPLEELGDVSYQLQRYDRAVEAYARAVKLDDRSARFDYKLALARYRGGDVDAALAAAGEAIRLDPRLADAHYLLGICLRERRRPIEAARALEKAVALSPTLIIAREELADLYHELDRTADHLEQLQVLSALDRARVERHVALGLAHARARHWDAAVLTLTSELDRHHDDPSLYRALGQIWLESAVARSDRVDLTKAREALERGASSPRATSELLMLAGRAALQDGDDMAAENLLRLATERFPIAPGALLLYASVAEQHARFDPARRALIQYEALVASDSELAVHAARIAAWSLRLEDAATAAQWIARGLRADPHDEQLLALERQIKPLG